MHKRDILHHIKANSDFYKKRLGVCFVGIFDSSAKEKAKENSDIDILYQIEANRKLSLFKYQLLIKELERIFHKNIYLVRYATIKPSESIEKDIKYV